MKKVLLLVVGMMVLSTQNIQAQWSEVYEVYNSSGWIKAIDGDNSGNIYVVGNIRNPSGYIYVAKWDGNSWSELGGNNSIKPNYAILTVCNDNLGNVYVAGGFINDSGNQYVAKWNGNSWSALGGLNGLSAKGIINTLCTDKFGNIYAAGGFTNDSGNQYVAKWDGNSWSELGGLNGLSANHIIYSLCTDKLGNIYAAGYFTNANGYRYVAKWDGSNWSELGGNNGIQAYDLIHALCSDTSGNIYAVGYFRNSTLHQYVAKWDGSNWSELGGGAGILANDQILAVTSDKKGNVYATGCFNKFWTNNSVQIRYVAKWNGISWNELGGSKSLNAYECVSALYADLSGDIYAAGNFENANGKIIVAKYHKIVGINELPTSSITLSPNPTTGITIITAPNAKSVEVIDVLGQIIQNSTLKIQNHFELDVSQLPTGIYFVRCVNDDGSVATGKFLKE